MRRALCCAAALLLLCAAAAQARVLVEEEEAAGRSLLQRTLDCSKVHKACNTCRNQRIKGTKKTETVCSTCKSGWRLVKSNNKACECQPGLALNSTGATGWCVTCTQGKYCPGGAGNNLDFGAELTCPSGLESKFAGAKSQAQCFTVAGYGRKSVRGTNGVISYEGVQCAVATYNVGGNTAGCQKCGAGLTTATAGSDAAADCLAPAGSYLDKGVGKKCPKGTYTEGLNTKSVCDACANGVTTAGEGSTSAAACDRAIKGYKYVGNGAAAKCDINTYNDAETTASACTPCPNGWLTQADGADGLALCLAPPGFELKSGATTITECELGSFKEGWNRNPCLACGTNVVTNSTGSVSKDACLVPPGYGLTQLAPTLVASPCTQNSYGDDVYRVAVASARCTPCRPSTFTDEKWGGSAPATGYTSEDACKVDAGYGLTETAVEECQVGFFNVGQNRLPCTACPAQYTTLDTKSDALTDCVIKAGWYYDADKSLPAPCDKGSYSTGGTAADREPLSCNQCNTGYTTQEQEADAATDCAVCAAGYGTLAGESTCTRCPVNTFSSGGLAVGVECTACASGTVSSKGATESSQCYPEFADPTRDYFTSTDAAAWTDVAGAAAQADCEAACGDNCLQLRISADPANFACQVMNAAAGKDVSFKVRGGVDYVRYTIGATTDIGKSLGTASAADLTACEAACTPNGDCEGVTFDGTTCTLVTSELDPDYTGFVHVSGSKLRSYVA